MLVIDHLTQLIQERPESLSVKEITLLLSNCQHILVAQENFIHIRLVESYWKLIHAICVQYLVSHTRLTVMMMMVMMMMMVIVNDDDNVLIIRLKRK